MNIRILACGIILGAAASTLITGVLSDRAIASEFQDPGDGMPTPEEMQQMMEDWVATMTPGPQHEYLQTFVGTWDTTHRTWWGGPGTPATETHGTAEISSVLDGRYTQQSLTSTFEMPDATGGMNAVPYSGLGFTGYDNVRNLYIGTWMDNLGTQILTMKGSASPDGKTITMYGEMDEKMINVYGRTVKYVINIESADRHTFVIYDLHAGDDYKVMEIVYQRKP